MKSKESKTRSAKEVAFSADALLQSLRDHADHLEGKKRLTLRVSSLILPPPVPFDGCAGPQCLPPDLTTL